MIAKKYNLSKDYITDINLGRNHYNSNLQYPIRQNSKHKTYCIDCGTEVSQPGVTRCFNCASKHKQTVIRPSPQELAQEIINSSFVAVGEKYGVSDNAIRK